jgi:hypothetical protein
MTFNAVFPIVGVGIAWGLRILSRWMDRGYALCNNKEQPTRSKTINQYLSVMSGDVYEMHYMYASVLNICFVTLMYGYFLPKLYPIAAFSFLVLYLTEKAQLYYVYRMPPSYNELLSEAVITTL